MNFLFPNILWGLLAVAIPVIIHLFNFRKFRRVYFTNVRFLEELKQQTQKQSKLRHILVMISRMLAIAALIIAFSQPFIPHEQSAARPDAVNQVNIYVDNSFSMEALSSAGPLIELAKTKAKEIASAYHSTDLFMLTTNEFEGRHQRWVSQDELLQLVDEIKATPSVRSLSEVISRQNDSYYNTPGQSKISYVISDYQVSMVDFEKVKKDSLMSVSLVPLESIKTENLYIDSCWFVSPVHQLNQGVKLVVRIVNDSETNYEKVPLKLSVNGNQKALASFDVRPGTFIDVELPFTNYETGIQHGTVEITDYPVVFDDRMYMVYNVAGSIPVLAINGREESAYLNSLFGADSAFTFVNNSIKNVDYNRLQEYELVILDEVDEISSGLAQELSTYLENGGNLLVIPPVKAGIPEHRDFLSSIGVNFYTDFITEPTRVSFIDTDNPVFSDVFEKSHGEKKDLENTDLPVVNSYYQVSSQPGSRQIVIMSMLNAKPFLTSESAGNGQVYLLAVPLEEAYSNFARHALFVPVMYRIALLSAATDPLYYTIGKDDRIELPNAVITGDHMLKIASESGDFEFIPGRQNLNKKMDLFVYNQVTKAGHYKLLRDGEVLKGLGFNYNRKESIMKFDSGTDLQEQISRYSLANFRVLESKDKPLSEAIKDMNQGTSLWNFFIILALVFLATEVALLRFWRSV
jgi:hypothetical protein